MPRADERSECGLASRPFAATPPRQPGCTTRPARKASGQSRSASSGAGGTLGHEEKSCSKLYLIKALALVAVAGVPLEREGRVRFGDRSVRAETVIWAAGVRASPAAEWLGAAADHAGRILIEADLTVPRNPNIFAIGDTVGINGPDGSPVPKWAPAAKQGGHYVASVIRARLAGAPGSFHYHDGSLPQVGKRKAVIDFGWIWLRGASAWSLWGIAHIYFWSGSAHVAAPR